MRLSKYRRLLFVGALSIAWLATGGRPVHSSIEDDATAMESAGNYAEAATIYRKVGDQGSPDGWTRLCRMMLWGKFAPKDREDSLHWCANSFRKTENIAESIRLAERGDQTEEARLALAYEWGYGVPKDPNRELEWARKAADQGQPLAQYTMGILYASGLAGLPKSIADAYEWYKKAADQDYAAAEANVALWTEKGWSVQEDDAAALNWYRKAASHGIDENFSIRNLEEKIRMADQERQRAASPQPVANSANPIPEERSQSGEPTAREMESAVQDIANGLSGGQDNLAARCARREYQNDPGLAMMCLGQIGAGGPMHVGVVNFRKIACDKARGQPGYICDYSFGMDVSSSRNMGFLGDMMRAGSNCTARFVMTGSGGWMLRERDCN